LATRELPHAATDMAEVSAELADKILDTLGQDFQEHGAAVVTQLREGDPKSYLTLLCRFVPTGGRDGATSVTVHTSIDLAVRDG